MPLQCISSNNIESDYSFVSLPLPTSVSLPLPTSVSIPSLIILPLSLSYRVFGYILHLSSFGQKFTRVKVCSIVNMQLQVCSDAEVYGKAVQPSVLDIQWSNWTVVEQLRKVSNFTALCTNYNSRVIGYNYPRAKSRTRGGGDF